MKFRLYAHYGNVLLLRISFWLCATTVPLALVGAYFTANGLMPEWLWPWLQTVSWQSYCVTAVLATVMMSISSALCLHYQADVQRLDIELALLQSKDIVALGIQQSLVGVFRATEQNKKILTVQEWMKQEFKGLHETTALIAGTLIVELDKALTGLSETDLKRLERHIDSGLDNAQRVRERLAELEQTIPHLADQAAALRKDNDANQEKVTALRYRLRLIIEGLPVSDGTVIAMQRTAES